MALLTCTFAKVVTLAGFSFATNFNLVAEAEALVDVPAAPVVATAALTTRTSTTVGILTTSAGPAPTTAQRGDLYWIINGVYFTRVGVTVGTVTGSGPYVVPFSGGTGADLPPQSTTVYLATPVGKPISYGTVAGVLAFAEFTGSVTFAASDNSTVFSVLLGPGQSYTWLLGDNGTNPLSGGTATQIFVSHADPLATHNLKGAVLTT